MTVGFSEKSKIWIQIPKQKVHTLKIYTSYMVAIISFHALCVRGGKKIVWFKQSLVAHGIEEIYSDTMGTNEYQTPYKVMVQ